MGIVRLESEWEYNLISGRVKEGFAVFHAPTVQCTQTTEMRCHDRAVETFSTGGRVVASQWG